MSGDLSKVILGVAISIIINLLVIPVALFLLMMVFSSISIEPTTFYAIIGAAGVLYIAINIALSVLLIKSNKSLGWGFIITSIILVSYNVIHQIIYFSSGNVVFD